MLFAGSAYSELPISTSKQQELNGEEFYYNLLIDRFFGNDLEIQMMKNFGVELTQNLMFDSLDIQENKDFELFILKESDLSIDLKR